MNTFRNNIKKRAPKGRRLFFFSGWMVMVVVVVFSLLRFECVCTPDLPLLPSLLPQKQSTRQKKVPLHVISISGRDNVVLRAHFTFQQGEAVQAFLYFVSLEREMTGRARANQTLLSPFIVVPLSQPYTKLWDEQFLLPKSLRKTYVLMLPGKLLAFN